MNRMGLGLAIGAGYLLGRTKKLKMAVAVGGLVAGKKLNLSPRMVADLVQQQLKNNPQFKEIGDQLRGELQGVGKAASGALVERQLDALADRLHGRTAQMREQLNGGGSGRRDEDADDAYDDEDEEPEGEEPEDSGREEDEEPEAEKAPAKKAPAKKAAKKAPAKKTAAARKTAAKKTSAARKTAAGNRGGGSRSRQPKGGGEE
ncbi:DNA primase [Streptomyces sp. XY006]|uniref:DNA primase n=1 Tax=Streptomyces sp. XY006 TaxID=2021410 RepID=UPI000B8C1AC5|nr:DNA primase [Streptomyces sp. XY006]OXS32465.1 DNA primase [Streptomyces sp. XY006]